MKPIPHLICSEHVYLIGQIVQNILPQLFFRDFNINKLSDAQALQYASHIAHSSGELIRDNLIAIMEQGELASAIRLMDEIRLLPFILPEISALHDVEQDIYYHFEGDVFIHTLLVVEKAKPTVASQLAALLHDIGKPATQSIHPIENKPARIKFIMHEKVGAQKCVDVMKRLKFDDSLIAKIQKMILFHLRAHTAKEWSTKALRKFIRDCGDDLDDILHLTEIDGLSSLGPDGNPKENIIPRLREQIIALSQNQ